MIKSAATRDCFLPVLVFFLPAAVDRTAAQLWYKKANTCQIYIIQPLIPAINLPHQVIHQAKKTGKHQNTLRVVSRGQAELHDGCGGDGADVRALYHQCHLTNLCRSI